MELEEEVEKQPAHHKHSEVAYNRPDYREAKRERAVKVYTVSKESKYLLVQNVHALGVTQDLLKLFSLYGDIEEYRLLDEYPSEPYTDVYWIKFVDINSARIAKKKISHKPFFGKLLHVCYAPEYETVQETREKLQERRKVIAKKTRETFESAQKKPKVKGDETKTEQSTSPATSVGHTPVSESHEQSHDTVVIPGLPPLPLLPTPPTHTTPITHYPSSLAGSEGGLYSTSGEQATGKSAALSQPCEKPLGSQKTVKPSSPVTHSKPTIDAVLFNPTGLSKSERVSEYLATKTATETEATAVTPGLVAGEAAHLCVTPHSQVTGPTSKKTGSVSTVSTRHGQTGPTSRLSGPVSTVSIPHRQTGPASRLSGPVSTVSTPHGQTGPASRLSGPVSTVSTHHGQTGPAVDSTLHRVTSNSNGAAGTTKTSHYSSTPLIAMTGNHSLDKSVQSVRDQMTKVWKAAPITLPKPKPKKRKRI